jgi:glucosamine-6-phosphate deaminase
MRVLVFESKESLGEAAAIEAAAIIRRAIAERGEARLIAATGSSQFEFLDALARQLNIDWSKTVFFHLDEYVGLSESHPASFRKYLKERIVNRIHPGTFHFVNGEAADPGAECRRIGELISTGVIDVAFVGIGENGHLAFNDPPADFETEEPYIVVQLDKACRQQQVNEGWFASMDEVPDRAISMSIRQILKSERIICVVPDRRKAFAVRECIEEEISPWRPASALRQHSNTSVYLDTESAALLHEQPTQEGSETVT